MFKVQQDHEASRTSWVLEAKQFSISNKAPENKVIDYFIPCVQVESG